jgi:hypothetical protein
MTMLFMLLVKLVQLVLALVFVVAPVRFYF